MLSPKPAKFQAGIILLAIILVPLIVYLGFLGFLWLVHDFSPWFLKIDRCLDLGGVWDYLTHTCSR